MERVIRISSRFDTASPRTIFSKSFEVKRPLTMRCGSEFLLTWVASLHGEEQVFGELKDVGSEGLMEVVWVDMPLRTEELRKILSDQGFTEHQIQ